MKKIATNIYIQFMLREDIGKHILKIRTERNLSAKEFGATINIEKRTAQLKFKNNNWSFEEIEAIEKKFGEKILYLAKDYFAEENVKAVIQIELKNTQKNKILKHLIGKKDLEIINT